MPLPFSGLGEADVRLSSRFPAMLFHFYIYSRVSACFSCKLHSYYTCNSPFVIWMIFDFRQMIMPVVVVVSLFVFIISVIIKGCACGYSLVHMFKHFCNGEGRLNEFFFSGATDMFCRLSYLYHHSVTIF